MERADEHRQRLEEIENLHMAVPLEERHGSDQWTMSLRNNWTRYVPVGNIFSGLFCPVEDKPNKVVLRVRREELAPPGTTDDLSATAATAAPSDPALSRTFRNSSFLKVLKLSWILKVFWRRSLGQSSTK